MKKKTTNQEYKNFLELKIQDRKDKIFVSLEREFINYLTTGKVIHNPNFEDDGKNFTNFFTRILKNVFFASLYKKLSPSFLTKLNSFQRKSIQSFEQKSFKRVVIISDKKVDKNDYAIAEFAKTVTQNWNANLIFRSMPQHDKNWLVTNIVTEINRDLFEKSITNILKKYPKGDLPEKYSDLKKISDSQLGKYWNKFVETRVWYSYERYVKAYEMLADREIYSKLNEIYSLIDDETLLIVYNNSDNENTFFDYLFNFENELFNNINEKKNLSLLVISENNAYKNTFLGLISIGNIDSISEVKDLDVNYDNVEDTIDFSDYNLNPYENYSNTIELFSDKKSIAKKKTTTVKKAKKKTSKNITDLTKTISLSEIDGDSGTLEKFISDNSQIISKKKTFDADETTFDENDSDLMKPMSDESSFINRELEEYVKEIESKNIFSTNKNYSEEKKVSTIDFDILDEEAENKNVKENELQHVANTSNKSLRDEVVSKKIFYENNNDDTVEDTKDNFIKNIVVDSFATQKSKTESNAGLDKIVSISNRDSLLNAVKYQTAFKIFVNIFKNVVSQRNLQKDFSEQVAASFEDKLKSFNVEGMYKFVKNNSPKIVEVLYSENIKSSEVNRCFAIYDEVNKKLNEVSDLITLLIN